MSARDDRGLIGKILVLWLLLVAAVALLALDGGSIVLTRVRVADLARDTAGAAADALERTGSEEAAKLAALQTIADADTRARLQRIQVRGRTVRVVLAARARTFVVGRLPVLEDLTRVTSAAERSAPGA